MSDSEIDLATIMANPTRCYADCNRENEILVHLRDDPWGGADLCWHHAAIAVRDSETVLTCDCPFCVRARKQLLGIESDSIMALTDVSDGRWRITTATGSVYDLDLDRRVMTRVPASVAAGAALRRDGQAVQVEVVTMCAVGYPAVVQLSGVAEAPISTQRTTSPVLSITRHGDTGEH